MGSPGSPAAPPWRNEEARRQAHRSQIQPIDWGWNSASGTTQSAASAPCLSALLAKLRVADWIEEARYPETAELTRTHSFLSFLALKLAGYERYSHDDLWAMDRSLGLFAGLNVLPKDATLSSYSYR